MPRGATDEPGRVIGAADTANRRKYALQPVGSPGVGEGNHRRLNNEVPPKTPLRYPAQQGS